MNPLTFVCWWTGSSLAYWSSLMELPRLQNRVEWWAGEDCLCVWAALLHARSWSQEQDSQCSTGFPDRPWPLLSLSFLVPSCWNVSLLYLPPLASPLGPPTFSLRPCLCGCACMCVSVCVCVGKVWKKITIVQKASLVLVQCVFMKFPQGGFQRPLGTLLREKKEKKDC